jgi:hypothetical protein
MMGKNEILNIAPNVLEVMAEYQEKKAKRGRPTGQFDYHKLMILKFLQAYTEKQGVPFEGTNDELAQVIGEWGEHWRIGVSGRQMARYLRKLQEELTPEGKPRIEVAITRYKSVNGGFGSRRRIHVNDLRDFPVSHLDFGVK